MVNRSTSENLFQFVSSFQASQGIVCAYFRDERMFMSNKPNDESRLATRRNIQGFKTSSTTVFSHFRTSLPSHQIKLPFMLPLKEKDFDCLTAAKREDTSKKR
jgi:predicted ATP-grasp superfamily ATP-dependent carboligase